MAQRGEDVRGALAQVCQDAARLLREGQAARAYSGLVAASRSLPMTPRLAAVLVRHALRAGTERAVISLLDAAMVAERGVVRREVRRQLSRVLRRSGQEARAAAVLNGLLMDAPGDARARFVMDVLRERVAKGAPSRQEPEEDESRTKTVEVSALALSDPERGNTVLELPTVPVEVAKGASGRAARADTVQVPLGEWAGLGRAARGPEFPWEDEGPGKARAVTPVERAVPSPEARGTKPVDAGGGGGPVEAATLPVPAEEAPESERAEAAVSFHSTEFPFVTGDAGRSTRGGGADDPEGASLGARATGGEPTSRPLDAAGAAVKSSVEAVSVEADPLRLTDAGEVSAPEAHQARGASARAESTPDSSGSSRSAGAFAHASAEEKSAATLEVSPSVVVSKAAEEKPAAASSVSPAGDVAQVADEGLAASNGSSADVTSASEGSPVASSVAPPVDVAQASEEKPGASSSVDVTQAIDGQLAVALGVPSQPGTSQERSDPPGAFEGRATAPPSPLHEGTAVSDASSKDLGANPTVVTGSPAQGGSVSAESVPPNESETKSTLAPELTALRDAVLAEAASAKEFDAKLFMESSPTAQRDALLAETGPSKERDPSSTVALNPSALRDAVLAEAASAKELGAKSTAVPELSSWLDASPTEAASAKGLGAKSTAVPELSSWLDASPMEAASAKELGAKSTAAPELSSWLDASPTEAASAKGLGAKSTAAPELSSSFNVSPTEAVSAKDLGAKSTAAPELSSWLDASPTEAASAKGSDAKSTGAPEQSSSLGVSPTPATSLNEGDAKSTAVPELSSSLDASPTETASSRDGEAKLAAALELSSSGDAALTAAASVNESEAKPTAALEQPSSLDAAPMAAVSSKEREAKPTAAPEPSSSLDAASTAATSAKDPAAKSTVVPNPASLPGATPSGDQASAPRDSTLTSHRGQPRLLDSVLVPGAPSKAFDEEEPTSEIVPPRTPEPKTANKDAAVGRKAPRPLDSVLVPGTPSKGFDEDESTSEMIPPRPLDSVLVPGAPSKGFDEDESTSELIPPARSDAEAEKDAPASTRTRDEKSRTKPPAPSLRRTAVLVPAASNPAFDEEESTSEVVPPPADAGPPQAATPPKRDSGHFPAVKPTGSGANRDSELAASPTVLTPEESAELARSQRQESLLIARQAWRELAQLYLKRADRAKAAPERAEALTRLAEVMENELQDSAGAARMYREIVELTGERTALREQVRLLSQREDASLVRRALDEAIQRARTSRARAIALLTRGERLLNMGAPAKAREDFEAAEALVPGLLPVLAGLVRCVSDEERPARTERLRAACAAAPRRAPDRLDALRVLAQTAEEPLGDLRIAQWAWAEVLVETPDSEQPREHLLALARRLGDLPALSQLLHAQLAREPRGPAARKAHLERVATLEAMGDAGAALAELRQAVRFEPGHKEAWLLLAERCIEREQLGEAAWAMENAATATESDEERQRTWERLALFCREVLHNTERARIYARRAESLRKAREDRARPPPSEPPRAAPPPAQGVPPPSVLVAPPVTTGRIPASRKDLSDEVTANTDLQAMVAAEEDAPSAASAKRSGRAKGGAAPKSEARVEAGTAPSLATGDRSRDAKASGATQDAPDSTAASRKGRSEAKSAASVKAQSGSHAPVAEVASGARKAAGVKAPSGSHAPVANAAPGAESLHGAGAVKAPSGSHAPVVSTNASRRSPSAKAASGSDAAVANTSQGAEVVRGAGAVKAPSGSHAPVAGTSPNTEASRRSASVKAPSGSPPSLTEPAPGPSTTARAPAAKSARGTAKDPGQASDTGAPVQGSASMREAAPNDEAPAAGRKPRAPAPPPRERTTAFGAPLAQDSEHEAPVPSSVLAAPPTPSAVSRKVANPPAASRDPGPATSAPRSS
ncbi:hypothetical protein, partial [Corallococcus llansteffanensis]